MINPSAYCPPRIAIIRVTDFISSRWCIWQFVMLISWVRYAKSPTASWSESVSRLNLPFDLAWRWARDWTAMRFVDRNRRGLSVLSIRRRIPMFWCYRIRNRSNLRLHTSAYLLQAPREVSIYSRVHYTNSLASGVSSISRDSVNEATRERSSFNSVVIY